MVHLECDRGFRLTISSGRSQEDTEVSSTDILHKSEKGKANKAKNTVEDDVRASKMLLIRVIGLCET